MIRFISSNTVATLKTSKGKKYARGNFTDTAKKCKFSYEGMEVHAHWENNRINIGFSTENLVFVEEFSLEFKIKTQKLASTMSVWSESFGEITTSHSLKTVPGSVTQKQNRKGSWAMWITESPKSEGLFLSQIPPINHFVHFHYRPSRTTLKITWSINCTIPQNEIYTLSQLITHRGERETSVNSWKKQWLDLYPNSFLETGRKGWIADMELRSPKEILECAKKLRSAGISLDWLAIGPGYAKSTGDWLEPSVTFQNRMGSLSRSISELQFKPGICLAPFLVSTSSDIANKHQDWLVTNDRNIPVKVPGYINTRETSYILDITNPTARKHIKQTLSKIHLNWEISVFIAERLSDVICTGHRQDNSIPGGQLMTLAISIIKEGTGNNTILVGHNMPLLAAPGMCSIQTQSGLLFKSTTPQSLSCVSLVMLNRSMWNENTWLNACEPLPFEFITNPDTDAKKTLLKVIQIAAGAVIITGNLKEDENHALKELNKFIQNYDILHAKTLQLFRPADNDELLIIKSTRGWIAIFNFSRVKKTFRFKREMLKDEFKVNPSITSGSGTVFNSPEIDVRLPPWGHRLFKLM